MPTSFDGWSGLTPKLQPLRAAAGLAVVSVAVNGERVDVVARAGGREWRVVFGTSDAVKVDWLNVYERPVSFSGVGGGRAIIVNGPSSAESRQCCGRFSRRAHFRGWCSTSRCSEP